MADSLNLGELFDDPWTPNIHRVASFHRQADGSILAAEECDAYFGVTLTPDQVRRLAAWLLDGLPDEREDLNRS